MVSANDLYGGTNRFFRRVVMAKHKVDVTFVEATDPAEVEKAIRPNTKMVSSIGTALIVCVERFFYSQLIFILAGSSFLNTGTKMGQVKSHEIKKPIKFQSSLNE